MKLDWRIKAPMLRILSVLPTPVHLFASRHLSGRAIRGRDSIAPALDAHRGALAMLDQARAPRVFEFGAGKDLFHALSLCREHRLEYLASDLEPLLQWPLVERVLEILGLPAARAIDDLASIGLRYRAPLDARASGLARASFDICMTTDVLEHIPAADIERILGELFRILRPGGLCSFVIDHSDHYAHTDSRIGPHNYQRYSERAWRWVNPPNHYQNRLRPAWYRRAFERAGFVVEFEQIESAPALAPHLRATPFRALDERDAGAIGSIWRLRRP